MSTDLASAFTRQRKPRRCYNFDMWHLTDWLVRQIPGTNLKKTRPLALAPLQRVSEKLSVFLGALGAKRRKQSGLRGTEIRKYEISY